MLIRFTDFITLEIRPSFIRQVPNERDYVIQNSTPTYTVSDWSEAETMILHRYVTNFGSTFHLTERSEDLDGYSDVTYEGTVVLWDYSSVQFNYTTPEAYETIFMPDNIGTDISWPYVYSRVDIRGGAHFFRFR